MAAHSTSSDNSSSAATSSSPLLDKLPAEVRNEVYRLALTTSGNVEIEQEGLSKQTAVLRTCRQIRREATIIFFAENTFHATFTYGRNNAMTAFPGRKIGGRWFEVNKANMKHVKSLRVELNVLDKFAKARCKEIENSSLYSSAKAGDKLWSFYFGSPTIQIASLVLESGLNPTCITMEMIDGPQSQQLCQTGVATKIRKLFGALIAEFLPGGNRELLSRYEVALWQSSRGLSL